MQMVLTPEAKVRTELKYTEALCSGCMNCIVCPEGAIKKTENKRRSGLTGSSAQIV